MVKFTQHYICKSSSAYILKSIEENFPQNSLENICFVGLHACADLSVTVLDIFLQNSQIKTLIMMPCCYHRMKISKTDQYNREYFENFPISHNFKKIFEEYDGAIFLKKYFLRNACQQSNIVWKNMTENDHKLHAENLMFRAILQTISNDCKYKLDFFSFL